MGIGNTLVSPRYKINRSDKFTPKSFFVGQSIEISNPFLEDFKKVIAFVAYINKSPSQEGDLGGG